MQLSYAFTLKDNIYSTSTAATAKATMPRTPASILLAAPWKASVLGRVFPLGLAGDVPLAAAKGAALPGTLLLVAPLSEGLLAGAPLPDEAPLPGAPLDGAPLLEEAPLAGTLLAGAPLPDEAPLPGAPLAGALLPDEAPLAGALLPGEAPPAGTLIAGAPLPEEAPLAGALLPDELLGGDPLACWPLSTGDCGLAVWLGLTGIGMIDIVKVWTGEAFAGAGGWLPP